MLHYLGKSHRLIISSLGFLLSILPIVLTIFDQILGLNTSSPSATLGKALYQFSINNNFEVQFILTLGILFSWLYGSWLMLWIMDISYLRKTLSESIQ